MNRLPIILLLCLIHSSTWAGDTPLTYDRIHLSATANEEVDNDTLSAVLYHQLEGEKAEVLADKVNKTIGWGVKQAKAVSGIKVQTLDYQTNPIYRKQRLTGWRVRQSIRLESLEWGKLSTLIGELQKRLSLQHIGYTVSTQRRKETEERLITQAIEAFSQRANLITNALGRSKYRLVEMRVGGGGLPPIQRDARPRLMMMEAKVAAPTLEPGSRTISVNASGTIELQLD